MLLADVRAAVKAALDAAMLPGLTVYEHWPNNPGVESGGGCTCLLNLGSIEYGETFGSDHSVVTLELHVFTALAGGFPNAEINLDPYLSNSGARSILQAIRGNPYLSGQVLYCLPPLRIRDYGEKVLGPEGRGLAVVGAIIDLEVHVASS